MRTLGPAPLHSEFEADLCNYESLYILLPSINLTELIFIQESGYHGFGESGVDTELRIFWNTFTWVILDARSSSASSPVLTIRYLKSILTLYSADPQSLQLIC